MSTKYKFPIGDWSGDGHEKCEWVVVSGSKSVQAVREAHFKCPEVLGFDIGDICREYEEYRIKDDILQKIKNAGINEIYITGEGEPRKVDDLNDDMYKGVIVDLWVAILNFIDNSLDLKVEVDDLPTINFYGYDEQKRHLNTPGYGLFY